jgi:hypothetical protein
MSFSPLLTTPLDRSPRALVFRHARTDINSFVTAVMRDEKTGRPLRQAPVHQAWHELADKNNRLILWSAVEHGKTTQLSIARTLHELGKDPTLRCAIVSNAYKQSEKLVRMVGQYIETSPELHEVFPELRPATPWTNQQLYVVGNRSKDPSVQAVGVHGTILGARIDRLILDDILDFENCRTATAMQDLYDWFHATLEGRLTKDARIIFVGTAFHPEDLMHRLAKSPGWSSFRYPVVDNEGKPRWKAAWPEERIAAKKAIMPPIEFARQFLCLARDDAEARFKREWIDRCIAAGADAPVKFKNFALWNGLQCYGLQTMPPGCKTYTGVDLAVQQHAAADWTVFFTLLLLPDQTRVPLEILAGKWTGPEIVDRIIDVNRRFFSFVVVENNAAQDFILQFTRNQAALPLRAHTTGRNKAHPEFGIESIAAEMSQGKWAIPSTGPIMCPPPNVLGQGKVEKEVAVWIQDMLFYKPDGHTPDRMMAAWFAREGIRMGAEKVSVLPGNLTVR